MLPQVREALEIIRDCQDREQAQFLLEVMGYSVVHQAYVYVASGSYRVLELSEDGVRWLNDDYLMSWTKLPWGDIGPFLARSKK